MFQQIERPARTDPLPAAWPGRLDLARIVAVVQNDPDALAGSPWYFVRCSDREGGELYRLTQGSAWAAPRVEPVNCRAYGIEGDDLDTSVNGAREYEEFPGLYHTPDVVRRKLNALDAC